MFNIAVGILWQIALVALPLYIVLQQYGRAGIAMGIIAGTSAILKFTWYDHLAAREADVSSEAERNDRASNRP